MSTVAWRPLRVAVVAACPFPLARGTPVRILRLAEALAERGHEVHVTTYHLGAGEVPAKLHVHRIRDVPSYTKLSPGPTYGKLIRVDPLLVRLTRDVLKSMPFDAIHAHHYEGLLVAAAARRGMNIPLVYDAHVLLMSELPSYSLGLPHGVKKAIAVVLDRWLPKLADHTVCVTQTIRDLLIAEAKLDPSLLSVMMNGVEYEHFDPAPYPDGVYSGARRVMFTGNLAEYQGVRYLLRAFAQVLAQIPDATLVIGTDSPFGPYEQLAAELRIRERIELVDSPSFAELPRLLASAHVAVNPRVGGTGVPVKMLNYMAAQRAFVSFDSSAPGVVHGQTGWLVSDEDVAAMADGIVMLLKDPERAARLGKAARAYISANARWSVLAERCEALYAQLGNRATQ